MTVRKPWLPPPYEQRDVRAVQALAQYAMGAERPFPPGEEPPVPSPQDVKCALDWIIKTAAGTYDEPFEAGQPDVVNYMLGRRSVGLAIVKLMSLRPAIFDKDK